MQQEEVVKTIELTPEQIAERKNKLEQISEQLKQAALLSTAMKHNVTDPDFEAKLEQLHKCAGTAYWGVINLQKLMPVYEDDFEELGF